MKKSHLILLVLLLMVIGYATTQIKLDINGRTELSENISDFKVYLDNLKLNGTEIEGINETKDGYEINIPSKGTLEYDVVNDSTEYDVEATVECEENNSETLIKEFAYKENEETFTVPKNGKYKLETWGAQGGDALNHNGGYGGYSVGTMNLSKNDVLYINVGGSGKQITSGTDNGGYNGGGAVYVVNICSNTFGSGGGATHIAKTSGQLYTLSNSLNNILIVSSGGAGASYRSCSLSDTMYGAGGSGGGIIGTSPTMYSTWQTVIATGGTQTSGGTGGTVNNESGTTNGSFGKGASYSRTGGYTGQAGGGGGLYGGGLGLFSSGAGGSSYIGNSLLYNKSMYCYNCEESTEESTRTISTTCVSETPTENCAKQGDGYAKIYYLEDTSSSKVQLNSTIIEAEDKINNKIEINDSSIKCSLKIKKISRSKKAEKYTGSVEWIFDYTGSEQIFVAPVSGKYKLETWGAQGGNTYSSSWNGGYGSYSTGEINLYMDDEIYINVGGKGKDRISLSGGVTLEGGYNGGGNSPGRIDVYSGSGGGATHIATKSGLLSSLENYKNKILIVSGAGGGATYYDGNRKGIAGSGGGIKGSDGTYENPLDCESYGTGGTQTSGGTIVVAKEDTYYSKYNDMKNGTFGLGSNGNGAKFYTNYIVGGSGGGGGFFGGSGNSCIGGAGGGSGYIGNSLLIEKSMYCYNCEESTEESTKTISTTCVSSTAKENCAKQGNGYARITLIK